MVRRPASQSPPRRARIQRQRAQTPSWSAKGIPNKVKPSEEAILDAATQVGEDGRGKDALVGYLIRIALTHPKLFVKLLGRVLVLEEKEHPSRGRASNG
jgi:hypothetical protein